MKIFNVIFATALIATGSAVAHADESDKRYSQGKETTDPYALEPCINGGVSANGLYPTQEAEFAALEMIAKHKRDPSNK